LSTIPTVYVTQTHEYKWTVEFTSDIGNLDNILELDTEHLSNGVVGNVTVELHGQKPLGYGNFSADLTSQAYVIQNLNVGQDYNVRVTCVSEQGRSPAQYSRPVAIHPPMQKPAQPENVRTLIESATSLRMQWQHPSSDGGDSV
jgi:hypothetical protein